MATTQCAMTSSWQLVELHGLWWAYKGELPPPEAFQTHGRPRHLPILGPYASRVIAEALLRKQLDRRDPEGRTHADPSGRLRRVQW
jgi:hypothetical protein